MCRAHSHAENASSIDTVHYGGCANHCKTTNSRSAFASCGPASCKQEQCTLGILQQCGNLHHRCRHQSTAVDQHSNHRLPRHHLHTATTREFSKLQNQSIEAVIVFGEQLGQGLTLRHHEVSTSGEPSKLVLVLEVCVAFRSLGSSEFRRGRRRSCFVGGC